MIGSADADACFTRNRWKGVKEMMTLFDVYEDQTDTSAAAMYPWWVYEQYPPYEPFPPIDAS